MNAMRSSQKISNTNQWNPRYFFVSTWVATIYAALLALTTYASSASAARAPVFVTKKPAMTQEYTLLSTYVNPASEVFKGPEVIESQDGILDITCAYELSVACDVIYVRWQYHHRRAQAVQHILTLSF